MQSFLFWSLVNIKDFPDCQEKGWVLDGFPRTSNQERALQNTDIDLEMFLFLSVPEMRWQSTSCWKKTRSSDRETIPFIDWNPLEWWNKTAIGCSESDCTVKSMKQQLNQFGDNESAVKGCYNSSVKIAGVEVHHAMSSGILTLCWSLSPTKTSSMTNCCAIRHSFSGSSEGSFACKRWIIILNY